MYHISEKDQVLVLVSIDTDTPLPLALLCVVIISSKNSKPDFSKQFSFSQLLTAGSWAFNYAEANDCLTKL